MQMRETKWLDKLQSILQILPFLGIIGSIGTIILFIYLRKWDILPFALTLLIPTILVSVFYIWRKKSISDNISTVSDFCKLGWINLKQITLIKIFCILFCITIIWLLIGNTRDIIFIILGVLLFTTAIIQIFLSKTNGKLVVLQLVATALIFILSYQFIHYASSPIGDSLVHELYAKGILETGFVDPKLFGNYTNFPLIHISIAISTLLSSLPTTISYWISISLPMTIFSIFIYYITKSLTKSDRISAIAVFFYLITPVLFDYMIRAAPRSLSTMAFILLLYLLFRFKDNVDLLPVWILGIITTIYMLLAHHAQIILIYGVLTLVIISFLIYGKKYPLIQKGCALIPYVILGIMLPYLSSWITRLSNLLDTNFFGVINNAISSDTDNQLEQIETVTPTITPTVTPTITPTVTPTITPTVTPTITPTVTPTVTSSNLLEKLTDTVPIHSSSFGYQQIINISISFLLLIFILFGLYYIIHQKNKGTKVLPLWPFILIFFALFIPYVAESFTIIYKMEQIGRLQIVLLPLFSVVMAIGLIVLGYLVFKWSKRPIIAKALMVSFCILLVLSSPVMHNCRDSTAFSGNELFPQTANYFTDSELKSLQFTERHTVPYTKIYSDAVALRYFVNNPAYTIIGKQPYKLPYGIVNLFTKTNARFDTGGIFIFRADYFKKHGHIFYGPYKSRIDKISIKYTKDTYMNYYRNTYSNNYIYDSASVKIIA